MLLSVHIHIYIHTEFKAQDQVNLYAFKMTVLMCNPTIGLQSISDPRTFAALADLWSSSGMPNLRGNVWRVWSKFHKKKGGAADEVLWVYCDAAMGVFSQWFSESGLNKRKLVSATVHATILYKGNLKSLPHEPLHFVRTTAVTFAQPKA